MAVMADTAYQWHAQLTGMADTTGRNLLPIDDLLDAAGQSARGKSAVTYSAKFCARSSKPVVHFLADGPVARSNHLMWPTPQALRHALIA